MNKTVDETNFAIGTNKNIWCSGTLISTVEKRLILTAYHCIDGFVNKKAEEQVDIDGEVIKGPDDKPLTKKSVNLDLVPVSQVFWVEEVDEDKDGRPDRAGINYEGKIVARNKNADLAVIEIPSSVAGVGINLKAVEPTKLAPKDYRITRGEEVTAVGNLMGDLYATVSRGIVTSRRQLDDMFSVFDQKDSPKFYVQMGSIIGPGNSGGSLYNKDGLLIGVNVMGLPGLLGLAVPIETVYTLLEENCLDDEVTGKDPVLSKCAITPKTMPIGGVDSK
jgi:S1-C subfamily serine protease